MTEIHPYLLMRFTQHLNLFDHILKLRKEEYLFYVVPTYVFVGRFVMAHQLDFPSKLAIGGLVRGFSVLND